MYIVFVTIIQVSFVHTPACEPSELDELDQNPHSYSRLVRRVQESSTQGDQKTKTQFNRHGFDRHSFYRHKSIEISFIDILSISLTLPGFLRFFFLTGSYTLFWVKIQQEKILGKLTESIIRPSRPDFCYKNKAWEGMWQRGMRLGWFQ